MADHGQVEYATATGNDLPAHESTYKNFILLAYVGCCHIASIVAIHGLATGAKAPSAVMVLISLLGLAFTTAG